MILSGAIGTFFISFFSNNLILEFLHGEEDWIVDKFSCEHGEEVRITITNLGGIPIDFTKEEKVCEIYLEGNEKVTNPIKLPTDKKEINIPIHGNYSLIWNTSGLQKGIYRIKPCRWKGDTLIRSVFIHEKLNEKAEEQAKRQDEKK